MVCGAKRIRSLYLPSVREKPPGLSTTTPPKGLVSFFTINAAITPRRDAFAEQTSLPRALRTEPIARREGRPDPWLQRVVRA